MKTAAAILTIIWAMLMAEPALPNFTTQANASACSKMKPSESSCSKNKCSKSKKSKEKNDCENNRCNPLMSCPTGNFWLFVPTLPDISPITGIKQKIVLVNDNRISKQLTECWHPPEII